MPYALRRYAIGLAQLKAAYQRILFLFWLYFGFIKDVAGKWPLASLSSGSRFVRVTGRICRVAIERGHQVAGPFGAQDGNAVVVEGITVPKAQTEVLPVEPRPRVAAPKTLGLECAAQGARPLDRPGNIRLGGTEYTLGTLLGAAANVTLGQIGGLVKQIRNEGCAAVCIG